jgi:phosphohistidine phosphatase
VWVLRHAKAASQGTDDHDRPLTARGRRQAAEVGVSLARAPRQDAAPTPRLVLSSPARRALHTAELVVAELEGPVELVVERGLYSAGPSDVIDLLRLVDDDAPSVMVVGHNPTVHELVFDLLDADDEAGRSRLEQGFRPASLGVVEVPAPSWARLRTGSGTLLELRRPDS